MKMIDIMLCVVLVASVGLLLSGCGRDEEKKTDRKPVTSIEEYAERKGISLTVEAETTEESKVNNELEREPEKTPQEEPQEVTGNILIDATVKTSDAEVGTWAYVEVRKDRLKELSEEDFRAFAEKRVLNSGYKWFTILCDDGTGMQFAGSVYTAATYGKVDADGCITEDLGYIWLDGGAYRYDEE